jgi:hypothetical protein
LLAAVQPPFAGSVARIKMPGISAQQTPKESMPTQGNNSSGGSIAEAQTHGVTGEAGVGEKEQRLRQQLEGQGLSALQRQAAQCGVEPADVDGALDTACPKPALIDLLISRLLMSPPPTSPGAVPIKEQQARTRQQLESMKLTALQKRGVAAGLADEQMEGAVDSVDPRAALIELLMSQPAALAFATAAPKEVRPARREAHLTQQRKATSLSAELEHMAPSQLRKRAVAEGVEEEQIETAEDAESPKREMIELIVAASQAVVQSADAALRAELEHMAPSQLRKRAVAEGVEEEQIEAAEDAESPKREMIELIVAASHSTLHSQMVAQPQARPHFAGNSRVDQGMNVERHQAEKIDAAPAAMPSSQRSLIIPSGKHCMLSCKSWHPSQYLTRISAQALPAILTAGDSPRVLHGADFAADNWDHQDIVTQARRQLQAKGIKCWMDCDGGMKGDLYDSMAAGVQGSAVVCCFMTRQYQQSQNCKLEATFARQSGIPIVPVMLEKDWKASDWLGIITAGALWVPLFPGDTFEQGIDNLVDQIAAAAGTINMEMMTDAEATDAAEADSGDLFSLKEMRQELERLRADDAQPTHHVAVADGGQCVLPAVVPELLEDCFVASDSMHTLVDTVLSPTTRRCGFWGTGGVGKTTTSAWLVRQERVRCQFQQIVWVALGQSPSIAACQRQLFKQLAGSELALDLSPDEMLLALQQAFAGKKCLLVLDDCWEAEHVSKFAVIDDATISRVLISSRVRSTLDGCVIVDVCKPTEQDAIKIVMAAAGLPVDMPAPREATEVVRLCKLLPLTLAMAGRMVKELGLQQDWLEVTTMMKEELSGDGDARSAEDSIIATSLRALKGPHAASARELLKAFRLVPEDVKVPLEALTWVYEASTSAEASDSGAPSLLHLRRCTKMLIDRCLVLVSNVTLSNVTCETE